MHEIYFETPSGEKLIQGYPIECFTRTYSYGMCASLHFHTACEIILVQEGTQDVTAGNHIEHIKKGGLIYINSEQPHLAYSGCREKTVLTVIKFEPSILCSQEAIDKEQQLLAPFLDRNLTQSLAFEAELLPMDIYTLCENILDSAEKKEYGYEYHIKLLIGELVRFLAVTLHERGGLVTSGSPITGSELESFRAVLRYIDSNYSQEISIDRLTELCNLSYSSFAPKFRRFTGKTVVEYINSVRISQAQKLLQSTNMSISEIGEKCGFSDICYFSRVFKKISGQSPQKFKKG